MAQLLKYLVQLVLSPGKGWDALAEEQPQAEALMHRGLLPLLALTSLSEFAALFWEQGLKFGTVLIRAVVDFGAYFVTVYIARLVFDIYVGRFTAGQPDRERVAVLTVMAVGIMIAIQLIDNILPWNLVLLRFLPLYAVLVLYKSSSYMDVPTSREMNYMIMATLATVVTPLVIYYFFFFLLP